MVDLEAVLSGLMHFKNLTFDEKTLKTVTIGAHRFVIYLKNYQSGAIYC